AGSPVTFTDTSSPQATSWLWIFDDGGTSIVQSPTHTFTTAGTHRVALIASNGSGSSQTIKDVPVSAATSGAGAVTTSMRRRFEPSDGSRWRLSAVPVSPAASVWLQVASPETEEVVVYLRFLGPDGRPVLERRLAVAGGEVAVNDVAAYGLDGVFTLELVSSHSIEATLRQPFDLGPKRSRADDAP
ncbi:MAG: PKD domain-containing protein, partial [Acidobacteriota bacterium]